MKSPSPDRAPIRLVRQLGVPGATMLGLGSILGTGLFVSIGLAAQYAGPSLLLAILLAALLASCNALSSAQLAAAYPVSGGTYEYGYRLLSPAFGFLAGWMFLCAKTASAATAAIGAAAYGLSLAGISSEFARSGLAGLIALAVMALVLSGLRRSSLANTVIVSITIIVLLAFCVFAFQAAPAGAGKPIVPIGVPVEGLQNVLTATALMFVAYTGYGRVATLGEEVRTPRRTIPRAIISTLVVSALLYLLVAGAAILAIGTDGLAAATDTAATPLEAAARAVGGRSLGLVLALGAIVAMLGVLLNLVLGLSRVLLAMGRRGDMPSVFGRLSQGAEPVFAILGIGVSIALLAAFGSVETAWTFSALTVLIYYAITNIAAIRLKKSERLYPVWISWAGLIGCLSLAVFIPPMIWGAGAFVGLSGFAVRSVVRTLTPDAN